MQMLHARHCARDLCLLSWLILRGCHQMRKPAQRELVMYTRVHSQLVWELRTSPFQPTDLSAKNRFKHKALPILASPTRLLVHVWLSTVQAEGTRGGSSTESVRMGNASAFIHESWLTFCYL